MPRAKSPGLAYVPRGANDEEGFYLEGKWQGSSVSVIKNEESDEADYDV